MKRLTFAIAAFWILAATSVAGAADIKLKVLYQANHPGIYKPLAEAFSKSQDAITVELIPGSGNYEGIMQTLVRGRIANDLPDVSFLGFNFMRMTGDTELGAPIDSFIKAEGDLKQQGYLENMMDICVHNGTRLGMPFAISLPVIHYNLDLLKKAGVDTSDLNFDWNQIIDIANKINRLDDDSESIYFTYDASGNWTLKALIESAGGSMMNTGDTEITFDRKAGQWAFDILNRIGDAGFANISRKQARQSFAAGKLGILIDSSSGLNKKIQDADGVFKIGIGPFPVPDAFGQLPAGGNCVVMTTHDPARQAAAWEFIKFVTSGEGQRILAGASGYVPSNRQTLEGDNAVARRFSRDPHFKVVADALGFAGPSFSFPGKNSVRITRVIEEYMRRVLTNEIEPTQALSEMRTEVQSLL